MEHHTPTHNALALILFTFSWFCQSVSELTAELLYTWSFRSLSLISLILMIIINYPKAKASLKRKRNGNH